MSLTTDHWQHVFGFLTLEEVENVTEAIVASRQAFERSVFMIVKPRSYKPEYFTCKQAALRRFRALETSGKESSLCNWRFKVVKTNWAGCPFNKEMSAEFSFA
jgi:hypothetical protein